MRVALGVTVVTTVAIATLVTTRPTGELTVRAAAAGVPDRASGSPSDVPRTPSPTSTTLPASPPEPDPLLVDEIPVAPRRLGRGPTVLFVGDSLSVESAPHLHAILEERGTTLRHVGFGGTATCDHLDGIRDSAAHDRPDVVVLLFTGNALTPCITGRAGATHDLVEHEPTGTIDVASYAAAYRADTIEAIEAFPADTIVVIVGVPLTRQGPSETRDALEAVYREIAATRDNVHELSLDRMLTPGHEYHDTLPCTLIEPCTPGEEVPVRARDGGHLCAPDPTFCYGGFRVATMIADAIDLLVVP
ncbi:MAG TPA: hypothetical protein VF183_03400 [Acidimicrobiales bacterium]